MNELTFGESPAAMYLARTLMELDDKSITRSVGKRITTTAKCVNDIVFAYEVGSLPAKTAANCLRLMRADIKQVESDFKSKVNLVEQLCANVQIGFIKRAMDLTQKARKIERTVRHPQYYSKFPENLLKERVVHYNNVPVAVVSGNKIFDLPILMEDQPPINDILHARSLKRCIRQNKPHTRN